MRLIASIATSFATLVIASSATAGFQFETPSPTTGSSAGIVRDAVKTICSGENGAILQRRLEDMALYFNETGRADQGRLALAVALQVGEGGPGPLDVSFLTGLVQKGFAFYLAQEKTRAEEEASLIVKP